MLNSSISLATYNTAHRADVRDLAEMVDAATTGTTAALHLTDPEDSRSAVFNECVNLYAIKHNISEVELADALRDWNRIDPDATELDEVQAAYKQVVALGSVEEVQAANALVAALGSFEAAERDAHAVNELTDQHLGKFEAPAA